MRILNFLGQGRYHTLNDIPCQDSLIYRQTKNGRWVFAVSDGCSSSKFSHFGSKAVVKAVAGFFENYEGELSDSELKQELLGYMTESLRAKGRQLGTYDLSDLYATVVFAIAEKGKFLAGHIGDGALVCVTEGDRIFISDPENAGAANVTYFVGSESAGNHFHLSLIDAEGENQLRSLILFSDGPQKMFAEKGKGDITKGVSEIISKVRAEEINSCKSLKEYLFSQAITSIYDIDDDWSLIIIDNELSGAEDEEVRKPDHMTLSFYEKYLEQNPDAAAYIMPKINKFRAELDMEPLSIEEKKTDPFEELFERLISDFSPLQEKDYGASAVTAAVFENAQSVKETESSEADEVQQKKTEDDAEQTDNAFLKFWSEAMAVRSAIEEAGHFVSLEAETQQEQEEDSGFFDDFALALDSQADAKLSEADGMKTEENEVGQTGKKELSFEEKLEKIRMTHGTAPETTEEKPAHTNPEAEEQSGARESESISSALTDTAETEREPRTEVQSLEKISVASESIADFLAPDESNDYDSDEFFVQPERRRDKIKRFFTESLRRLNSDEYEDEEEDEGEDDFTDYNDYDSE